LLGQTLNEEKEREREKLEKTILYYHETKQKKEERM
jgi:hypothetical protein